MMNTVLRPLIVGLGLSVFSAVAVSGEGAPPAAVVSLRIDAQPLDAALNAWANQTGYSVLVPFERAARGKMAPRVEGNYTPEAALRTLLAGTDLQYEFVNERTVSIRSGKQAMSQEARPIAAYPSAAAPLRLAQAEVGNTAESAKSVAGAEGLEEVIVKGTTIDDPILSSRTGDTLRERPQSITIMSRELLEEQNLHSVSSVLEKATGLTVVKTSATQSSYYARGFQINAIQIDGGAPLSNSFSYFQLSDLVGFEQVEVMRGADALFSGAGQPGGYIQLVRKRPTKDRQVQFFGSAGRWDAYRAQVDVSGALAFDGKLRGRAVYMTEDASSVYRQHGESSQSVAYGILEADVLPGTLLSAGFNYGNVTKPNIGFGLPRYADGSPLEVPRETTLSATWPTDKITTTDIFAKIDQRLGDSWDVKINATRSSQETYTSNQYSMGPVDLQTGMLQFGIRGSEATRHPVQELFDVTLKGSFALFGHTHKIAIGADRQDIQTDGVDWSHPSITSMSVDNFDPRLIPYARSALPSGYLSWGQKQDGIYASVSLELAKPFHLLGGARYSNYETWYMNLGVDPATGGSTAPTYHQRYRERGVVTPYVGATYDLNGNWTVYGSLSEIYQSQANRLSGPVQSGSPLDAMVGRNLEVGIKGGLGQGRAATSIAVYQIDRENQAVLDPRFPSQSGIGQGASCCYVAQGAVESQGVDAEINGRLLENWQLFAGYTYNTNKNKSGFPTNLGIAFMPRTPKHLFKLWSSYTLPGALDRWKLGAGVTAQTKISTGQIATYEGNPVALTQGGYALFDARVEYTLSDSWQVALNAENLTDKTYLQSIDSLYFGNWYGLPRNVTLSVRSRW